MEKPVFFYIIGMALSKPAILGHIFFHGFQHMPIGGILLQIFINVCNCDNGMHLDSKLLPHFHNGGHVGGFAPLRSGPPK